MKKFSDVKPGDKVYHLVYGEEKIYREYDSFTVKVVYEPSSTQPVIGIETLTVASIKEDDEDRGWEGFFPNLPKELILEFKEKNHQKYPVGVPVRPDMEEEHNIFTEKGAALEAAKAHNIYLLRKRCGYYSLLESREVTNKFNPSQGRNNPCGKKLQTMKVKDIINHSNVEVNDYHETIDENAVPCNGHYHEGGNQPCFIFSDEFVREFGEQDATPVALDDIEDNELPEELALNDEGKGDRDTEGLGRSQDYEWFRINDDQHDRGLLFGVWGFGYTYDIYFNDDDNSNNKGFHESYQYCRDYIESNNGTNWSYFEDYKGGIVQIVCNETEEVVYEEEVR